MWEQYELLSTSSGRPSLPLRTRLCSEVLSACSSCTIKPAISQENGLSILTFTGRALELPATAPVPQGVRHCSDPPWTRQDAGGGFALGRGCSGQERKFSFKIRLHGAQRSKGTCSCRSLGQSCPQASTGQLGFHAEDHVRPPRAPPQCRALRIPCTSVRSLRAAQPHLAACTQ